MLKKLTEFINFFKNLTLDNIKAFFKDLGLYIVELLIGIWTSVKTNKSEAVLYIIWAVLGFIWGFTIPMIVMIIYSCYVHHLQICKSEKNKQVMCNHEDILRYTLIIGIFSLLHAIF